MFHYKNHKDFPKGGVSPFTDFIILLTMIMTDTLFPPSGSGSPGSPSSESPKSNVPEFSVGELALSLKRTLEDQYGRVRVRGELSRVSIAGSGHMYSSLKDDQAVIDAVCWKGTLGRLPVKPEEGLEVICTGRISSYPKSSKYQLVIESMELAGEGALLKMLEERKKKLAAEGLFAEDRKKPLPYLPNVIGVVTSPTGAVIRDILHRLDERFPRHVLVWPVLVQGDGAAAQISAAIQGFDAIEPGGPVPRPDLLIVARGGGSLEDLMAFNEENVVRAIASCRIPVISAVGHETDTSLSDYAADKRAPTPTGAAEIAVPRRPDLMGFVMDLQHRLYAAINRNLSEYRHRLEAQSGKLGNPQRLLEVKQQNLDALTDKLDATYKHGLQDRRLRLQQLSSALVDPKYLIRQSQERLAARAERLNTAGQNLLKRPQDRLESLSRLLDTLSFKSVLKRGYAVVRNADGDVITDKDQAMECASLEIEFKDDQKIEVAPLSSPPPSKPTKSSKKPGGSDKQKSLF